MNAFLITTAVLFAMRAGTAAAAKPNTPHEGYSSGVILLAFLIRIGFAAWAIVLLLNQ